MPVHSEVFDTWLLRKELPHIRRLFSVLPHSGAHMCLRTIRAALKQFGICRHTGMEVAVFLKFHCHKRESVFVSD